MNLSEIAVRLGCSLVGDGSVQIKRVSGLENALPGDLTFLSNIKYKRLLQSTKASAIILANDAPGVSIHSLRTTNPYLAFAQCIDIFYTPPRLAVGIHGSSIISKSAKIGKESTIGPFCFIDDDVKIGDRAIIHPHVTIYKGADIGDDFTCYSNVAIREFTQIGNRVVLQNGVVVGADGFGFAKDAQNRYQKITQSGRVVIEDDVEVQANATVDRAAIGETRIARGVKIDNLVQVGHGSSVGEDSLLCAQVGLAGSTTIGKRVVLTGQVGVAGHCEIGDDVIATAQSGIPADVAAGKVISGYPAMENRLWLKCCALFSRLPELNRSITKIQQQLDELLTK